MLYFCTLENVKKPLVWILVQGVVACTCNPAVLESEFRHDVCSIPVVGNSPLTGG